MNWIRDAQPVLVGTYVAPHMYDSLVHGLVLQCFKLGTSSFSWAAQGLPPTPEDRIQQVKELTNGIISLGYNLTHVSEADDGLVATLTNPNGLVLLSYARTTESCNINAVNVSEDELNRLKELFTPWKQAQPSQAGVLYMMQQQSGGGIGFRLVGYVGKPLEETNYSPNVLQRYRFIVDQICSDNPLGRLTILQGPPGCGKTYLVRALLHAIPSTNVLIPSDLIEEISKPSFAANFIDFVRDYKKFGPVICVIEDGDHCLVQRDQSNTPAVSNLLNLSDGLLGAIADVHVVVTTNAAKVDIDKALYRHMRLLQDVYVVPLESSQANKVYRRLGGQQNQGNPFTTEVTLADVYYKVRVENKDAPPDPEKKRPVGFKPPGAKLIDGFKRTG